MTSMNLKVTRKLIQVILESPDKSVVVKAMTKLRTDLLKDREGILMFLQADGLRPLIKFLGKPHEQILEIVLSIIGNCCTVGLSCQVVLKSKIISYLTPILTSIPNQLIQCRACRLLGNLAKYDCNVVLGNHQAAVIAPAVCKIIESAQQVETKTMAFRATRFLLHNPDYMKHFLQENGFTILVKNLTSLVRNNDEQMAIVEEDESVKQKVGLKMSQHREKYFLESACNLDGYTQLSYEQDLMRAERKFLDSYILPKDKASLEMISEILRCLLKVSEQQISFVIWENLIRNGCNLSALVYFALQDNNFRCIVLKTLSNFSKNLGAFVILSGADAVVAACDLVVARHLPKPLNEYERHCCLTLICMLSTDACHRAKIRRSGTLKTLINLIRDSQDEHEKSLILYILNNFQFDSMSLELMLWDGLVPVLIGELHSYLCLEDDYYKKRREERQTSNRKRKLSIPTDSFPKFLRRDLNQSDQSDDSPSSSPRALSIPSPCSSGAGGSSPASNSSGIEEDDETYSPVCSDDDDDDDFNPNQQKQPNKTGVAENDVCSEIMKLLDACHPSSVIDENVADRDFDDDEMSQDGGSVKSQTVFTTRSSLDIVENLLFHVSLLANKHDSLSKAETLETLFQSIEVFGTHNNFSSVLANVLGEKRFLERIVKCGIGHKLLILNKLKNDRVDVSGIIHNLSSVAESNYGKGELERFLRSETEDNQKRAAIFIAFVVKTHCILYHFLNEGNVFDILLNIILSNSTNDLTIEAIESLTTMSQETLDIKLPVLDPVILNSNYGEYNVEMTKDFDMICDMQFAVHSESEPNSNPTLIKFNKELLSNSSDVFRTMLNSSFREGTEGVINMTTCTPDGLRYFLNLIICQSKNEKINIPGRKHYGLILEAFEMSRVYIIPEMEQNLLSLLISLMNEQTCLAVMEWALKNYHCDLTETAINYYLCSSIEADKKLELFRNAHQSSCSTLWLTMLRDAVLIHCRP